MLYPGHRVGEYVLERRLGGGACGEVWVGSHHAWGDRRVAVKVPTDEAYLRSLQHGGRRVHLLDHPNIARAVAFDPFAQPAYLATEYVPGRNLRALIDEGPMPVERTLAVLRQVLLALDHAHGRAFVHGGLKPENVLIDDRIAGDGLDRPGAVKLTDFSSSDIADASAAGAGSITFSVSLAGERAARWAGSMEYASPEQRRGEAVDGRADLYACGVLLYEMLTGTRPAGVELPSDLRPDVPAEWDDLFRRAYARLERRFQSARHFLDALPGPARTEQVVPSPQATPEEPGRAWLDRIADEAGACRKAVLRGGVATAFLDLAVPQRLADWQRAAEAGFAEAQWLLGQCCERGLGVEWDLHRAARLYRQAAIQDYPPAMNNLGYLYLNGRGVDRNPRIGWRWYERAARMGFEPSRVRLEHLGLLSRHGRTRKASMTKPQ